MIILDISQPLGTGTVPWPGDAPFRLDWTLRRERGDSVNVAEIGMSVHVGTHADGRGHAADGERPIGDAPLEPYLGPAVVVDAVGAAELGEALVERLDLQRTPRVLFHTRRRADPAIFPHGFAALTPALARKFVDAGALLVGTDAPSVDPEESKTLDAHRVLTEGDVAILENLFLDDVPAGEYTLVALPLRLVEADSSPVRAVLLAGDRPGGAAGANPATGAATTPAGEPGGLVEFPPHS